MLRYRKKPVVVDAWKWEPTSENLEKLRALGCDCHVPDAGSESGNGALAIKTLENWFSYHPPTDDQRMAYEQLRDAGYMLARVMLLHCPVSADRSAALRKLREAIMTANASIACGGK